MPLDEKTKEMVAFGVAMGARCTPCMQWHYKKCLESGVNEMEMKEIMTLANVILSGPQKKGDDVSSSPFMS